MATPYRISLLVISVLTLTSLLFLVLINFSAPLITALYFLRSSEAGGVRFGLWGWCLEQDGTCSPDLQLNYTWEPQISAPVTGALVFYPLAAISTLLALISIIPLSYSPSVRSRKVFIVLALVSGLLSSVAFIFMIAIWGTAKKRFENAGFTASFGPLPWLSVVAAFSLNFVTSYASFESTTLSGPKPSPFVELYKDAKSRPEKTEVVTEKNVVPDKVVSGPASTEEGPARRGVSKRRALKAVAPKITVSVTAPAEDYVAQGNVSSKTASGTVGPKISSGPTPIDNSPPQVENTNSRKSSQKKVISNNNATRDFTAKTIASKVATSKVVTVERAEEKIQAETAFPKRTSKRAKTNYTPAAVLDIPTAAAAFEEQSTPRTNPQRLKRSRHTPRPHP